MPVYKHSGFTISSFVGGYDKNFAYSIVSNDNNTCVLVDAALPPAEIIGIIPKSPEALLITHSHGDHIAYLEEYQRIWSELKIINGTSSLLQNRLNFSYLKDQESFKIDDLNFTILHTPGHYPDSVCYKLMDVLFTGDTLFVGRTGRTVGQGSNIDQLYDSVFNKLLKLEKTTIIYPGHDYGEVPRISLEENRRISPLLQADSKEDFIKRMARFENER